MNDLVEFKLEELAKVLIIVSGKTDGLWRLAARFNMRAVTTKVKQEDDAEVALPAVLGALDRIALIKADAPGPLVFDAKAVFAEAAAITANAGLMLPSPSRTPGKKTFATKKAATPKKTVRRSPKA